MKTATVKKFICALVLSATSMSVFASGFRLPESSISGMALSNSVVANPETSGALIYNPALMSSQKVPRLVNFGITNINHNAKVNPDIGNSAESKGASNTQIPSFYYMSKLNTQLSWGIGFHAPFGLETKWPRDTFGVFTGATDSFEPEASKLEVLNLTPNVAYKIDTNNSIAFGINYYDVRDLVFNTQDVQISADGRDFGYTLAYFYQRGPWGFGATYRSAVETHVEGDINAFGASGNAEADIEFPKMLQLGVRNQINPKIAIEFDIDRTYWSSFDSIDIKHDYPGPAPIPNPIISVNNWKDTNAYRLGVTYKLKDSTDLYFGYTRDATPQPDKYFSARIPDADRQLLSVGFSHQVDTEWNIEGGILMVIFEDRTVSSSTPYDGKYKSDALLIGFGVNKTFSH